MSNRSVSSTREMLATLDGIAESLTHDEIVGVLQSGTCPLCRRSGFRVVAGHVSQGHGISRQVLRDRLGLLSEEPICSPAVTAAISTRMKDRPPELKQKLVEGSRQPRPNRRMTKRSSASTAANVRKAKASQMQDVEAMYAALRLAWSENPTWQHVHVLTDRFGFSNAKSTRDALRRAGADVPDGRYRSVGVVPVPCVYCGAIVEVNASLAKRKAASGESVSCSYRCSGAWGRSPSRAGNGGQS